MAPSSSASSSRAPSGVASTLSTSQRDAVSRSLLGPAAGAPDGMTSGVGDAPIDSKDLNVVEQYKAHFREDPLMWIRQVYRYGSGDGWRGCESTLAGERAEEPLAERLLCACGAECRDRERASPTVHIGAGTTRAVCMC